MKLRPPSTLIIGPAGTGKTTSLVTAIEAGLSLRLLATEPTAPNRVIEEIRKRKLSMEKFDWCFVSPSVPSWAALREAATIINTMTLKDIAELRSGIARPDGTQWLNFLIAIEHFKSERTGLDLGDATEWGSDVMFAIDGLTGISTMSRNLTIGLKPNPSPGEWGVMQSTILTLIRKLTADSKCFLTLIAHVEREMNEITGMSNITVSPLGAKLAPKLPPEFTTVVLAKRDAAKFSWSTAASGVDTKQGDLAFQDDLLPSFAPIIEGFRARLALANAPTPTAAPTASVQPAATA